jgi:hypothetical protein
MSERDARGRFVARQHELEVVLNEAMPNAPEGLNVGTAEGCFHKGAEGWTSNSLWLDRAKREEASKRAVRDALDWYAARQGCSRIEMGRTLLSLPRGHDGLAIMHNVVRRFEREQRAR